MLPKKYVIKIWIVPMTSAQTPLGVESTLPDHTQLAEDQFVWVRSRFSKNQFRFSPTYLSQLAQTPIPAGLALHGWLKICVSDLKFW